MPVLEHVFAAIFNFVAFPQQYAAIEPTSKHHQEENKRDSPARPLPRVQRRNSNNIGGGKRASKMETVKRRSRVFSMSLPVPPLVPGGPSNPTPPHRQTNSDGQRDKPNPEPSTSSSSSITNSTIQSGSTSHSHSKGKDTTKGWANWSHDTDVVGSISTEELTKLVATGTGPPPTSTTRTQGEQKKKGVKRKRSDSSVASISSSFAPLSKKISGLMAKAPKKAKIMGSGLSQATSAPTNSEPMQVQEPSIINACTDIHAALRQNGCRLVGSSVDVDDLYTDRPDDAILSTMSIVRIFTGEQQQLPPSYRKPNRLTIETLTYCLWVACHKSLIVFPYAEDKEEEAVKEERECYAIQLFMAELGMSILERLPQHGVLHVPVDPRVSNDVVDIIHHTLYLLGAFSEAGATPTDLYRLVFDVRYFTFQKPTRPKLTYRKHL
ncbi:hypothetical protein M408DRAFT_205938 [Serendipita vermifera MAFF 305830]|uniref:Uncharacterized protein n=1 Tax=Serendipita vermifera MAFF 305830 TaxID=933852 RepID=A0A0C3B2D7_SERVB|nr:hypothetical protein M408DRAFT_205938 [Serendipita vermifera MAFF 305830]